MTSKRQRAQKDWAISIFQSAFESNEKTKKKFGIQGRI